MCDLILAEICRIEVGTFKATKAGLEFESCCMLRAIETLDVYHL